jgi:hypothetical protein
MDFPERQLALAWVGRTLVDRDGQEIGACTAVFHDDATQTTEWLCSQVAGAAVFIPAVDAAELRENVQVAVSRADVDTAPSVGDAQHISADEEEALYRHYGIPHSRDASPTLLPTDEASDAATPEGATTPAAAEPVAAPTARQEPAPRTQPAWDAGQDRSEESAASAGVGRRILPAVGGLAAIGLAVGAVLAMRRLRRRPLTRTERLARRGRAAAAAVGARTGRIAASAAPLVESTKQVLRSRARVGAAAGVPAAAVTLTALRRRRSRDGGTPDGDRG